MTLKQVHYKLHIDFQSLLVRTYWRKNVFIYFVIILWKLKYWKRNSNNLILIIVYKLTKIYDYKLVKIFIDISWLAKKIMDILFRHTDPLNSIISNLATLFNFKFSFFLCYFLYIKQRLFITFYSQINFQTKRQNRTIQS